MITWFLVGVVAGFPVWFSAGWMVRRDEHRQIARQRDYSCTCTHSRSVTVVAGRAHGGRRSLPAAERGAR